MSKDKIIYHTGESALKSGDYHQLNCAGLFCPGNKQVHSVSLGEPFPKCSICCSDSVWTSVKNKRQIHLDAIYSYPHLHLMRN